MEKIQNDPPVLIDGAHNPNAINGLVESIARLHEPEKLIIIVGFLKDKQYYQCVDRLLDLPATFIITSPDNHERALPSGDLMQTFQDDPKSYQNLLIQANSIAEAVEQARKVQMDQKAIVIGTGSFYLINKIAIAWKQTG